MAEVGIVGFESFGRAAVVALRVRNTSSVPFRGIFEAPLCVSFVAASVVVACDDESTVPAGAVATQADLDDDVNVHGRYLNGIIFIIACVSFHLISILNFFFLFLVM